MNAPLIHQNRADDLPFDLIGSQGQPRSSVSSGRLKRRLIGVALFLGLLSLFLYAGQLAAETVNINKADIAAMQEHLPGIGPVKSQAIVDYRKKNGSFKSVNDLKNVPGIGDATLKSIKSKVSTSKGVTRASKDFKAKKASSSSSTKKSTNSKSSSASSKKKSSKDKDQKSKSASSSKKTDKSKKESSKKKASSKKDASKKSTSKKSTSKKSTPKKSTSKDKSSSKKSSQKKKDSKKSAKDKAASKSSSSTTKK